ncbi:MAG: hypothetical protein ACLR1V_03550 [Coprococcus sp.]
MDQKDAELLLKISHADSLQELVDLGFQLLGNPIFIDDMVPQCPGLQSGCHH